MVDATLIEACRKAFTGFEDNDKTDLVNLLADDIVFEFSNSLPYGGTYVGKAEFKAFWAHVYMEYEYFNYDARAVLAADDYVIVPVVARAKTKAGFSMENEHLFLFRVKNGKFAWGRIYADTARGRDVLEGRQPRRYDKLMLGSERPDEPLDDAADAHAAMESGVTVSQQLLKPFMLKTPGSDGGAV